jgi:hypothetical protein
VVDLEQKGYLRRCLRHPKHFKLLKRGHKLGLSRFDSHATPSRRFHRHITPQ